MYRAPSEGFTWNSLTAQDRESWDILFSAVLFFFFQVKENTQKDKVTAPGHTSGR